MINLHNLNNVYKNVELDTVNLYLAIELRSNFKGLGGVKSMEISRVSSRVEFKDPQKGILSLHSHAEVILIDKSSAAIPQVYELKADFISSHCNPYIIRQEFEVLKRDAFILVGNLVEIDTLHKSVRLTNNNLMTYKYLIVFSGNEHPLELSTVLPALRDALLLEAFNIKDIILKETSSMYPSHTDHSFSASSPDKANFDKVVQPRILNQQSDTYTPDIASSAKSLCQVKL